MEAPSPEESEPKSKLEGRFDDAIMEDAENATHPHAAASGTAKAVDAETSASKPTDLADEDSEDDADADEEEEEQSPEPIHLGGPIDTQAFALLDGIFEDPETKSHTRVTIPITRVPATLGRSHDTNDPHFFGLGKKKALSRQQCVIYYRDTQGGRVGQVGDSEEMVYKKKDKDQEDQLIQDEEMPENGFFVIECLGKNRILVNKERVDQGKSARLESGTPIRISSYMLYFLLPTDAPPKEHFIPDPTPTSKKRKKAAPSEKAESIVIAPAPATKRSKTSMGAQFQSELDGMSVNTLLKKMTEAIENNEWERRHQLIGSTISWHAVRDAARDPEIQALALAGGVSRSGVMTWIEDSPKYSTWVKQMLTKMESRSYQAAVTKSLLKAGYSRTGSSGRYIKWLLPKDIKIITGTTSSKAPEPESEQQEEEEEEDDDQDDQGREDDAEEDDEDDQEEEEDVDDVEGEGEAAGQGSSAAPSADEDSASELERSGSGPVDADGGDDDEGVFDYDL
jgi:hypothetical protein